jgi:hypothetical protein
VILGLVLWWFLFFAVGIAFGSLWPEYREAARLMFEGRPQRVHYADAVLELLAVCTGG